MKISVRLIAVAVMVGLLFVGCSRDKEPAELAMKGAEQAVDAVKAEASKYLPDQLKSVQEVLTQAKEKYANGEYSEALTGAKNVTTKANELLSAVTAKKEELTKSWNSASGGVQEMIDSIRSRIGSLASSKKLPANVTGEALAAAKTGLETVTKEYTAATDSFKSGNVSQAIEQVRGVKEQCGKIMATLGMTPPEAGAS